MPECLRETEKNMQDFDLSIYFFMERKYENMRQSEQNKQDF